MRAGGIAERDASKSENRLVQDKITAEMPPLRNTS